MYSCTKIFNQTFPTMNDNFLCRVSFAGVPHTMQHIASVGAANIFPLSPKDACRIYWLLQSIRIRYQYTINGIAVARDFTISSSMIPKNRLLSPAIFYTTEYDSNTQTAYMAQLDLQKIYYDPSNNGHVGFNFTLSEADNFGIMNLCLQPLSNMKNLSRSFSLAGKTMTAYLNYNSSMVSSATFHNISIEETYYQL